MSPVYCFNAKPSLRLDVDGLTAYFFPGKSARAAADGFRAPLLVLLYASCLVTRPPGAYHLGGVFYTN